MADVFVWLYFEWSCGEFPLLSHIKSTKLGQINWTIIFLCIYIYIFKVVKKKSHVWTLYNVN